jgi:hypothetical protein
MTDVTMTAQLPSAERFSFVRRPVPVPGDLRIAWRLALLLLMLRSSRSNKASLAKLHVLNSALRSSVARQRLNNIIASLEAPLNWRLRVEPALGRAIDFLVGEKLAEWTEVSDRSGLVLTAAGVTAADGILANKEVLLVEKDFLETTGRKITEALITSLVGAKKGF